MSRFINSETGVVVSVADDKDGRFSSGWEPVTDEKPSRSQQPAARKSGK